MIKTVNTTPWKCSSGDVAVCPISPEVDKCVYCGTFAFAWKVHRFSPEDPQRAGRKRWVGEGASSRSWVGGCGSLLIRRKTETRTHAWDQGCSIYRIHLAVYKSPGRLAESWKGSNGGVCLGWIPSWLMLCVKKSPVFISRFVKKHG